MDDFRKIDSSGRISQIYSSIPSQLALNKKRYVLSNAINKRTTKKDEELLQDLIDSKTVMICYNSTQPSIALSQTKNLSSYKLYIADIGLFTTLLFNDASRTNDQIYQKLLSNKLDVNLGYLYENAVAQIIKSNDIELYYHTWNKENSVHYYEIDFLVVKNKKVVPIEIKSGNINNFNSFDAFCKKYSHIIGERYIISQKDISNKDMIKIRPFYLTSNILK